MKTEEMIEKAMKALAENGMDPICVKTREEAVKEVEKLLWKGAVISCGGSVTLAESGILDLMRNGDYLFLDRDKMPREEVYQKTFSADVFLTSANAVTLRGELYNVDGNGNRVAAMIYGPKKVIVVVGANKLTEDLPAAIERVRRVAAPKNAARLHTGTPCEELGHCCAVGQKEMTAGCASESRICRHYAVTGKQKEGRVRVILVEEELGY